MYEVTAGIVWFLVRAVLCIVFFATPIIGFWLASSLAAFQGGPAWLAWTAGAFLFPILPGLWELHAWAYRRPESQPILTPLDRLGLRTFAIGLAFICVLLYLYPQLAFVSLSTRGDWMLDGYRDPRVESARRFLFASADGLEWLYHASRNNPFKSQIDTKALEQADEAARKREQELAEKSTQQESQQQADDGKNKQDQQADNKKADNKKGDGQDQQAEDQRFFRPDRVALEDGKKSQETKKQDAEKNEKQTTRHSRFKFSWPWKDKKLHPAVALMPASAETSFESVAKYLDQQEDDPYLRIKALHDYVANRVAYDYKALYSGTFPSQSARTVFETRKGVCAGYANLMAAMAKAMNEEVVVVVGDSRDSERGDKLAGGGHAWNAACIEGRWYLIDVTWDSGTTSRAGFTRRYRTDYLLPPAEVMIEDHFPENSSWQLLPEAISQGDFLRQPMLRPAFHAAGLTLVQPHRASNETGERAQVIVKNPRRQWLMVGLEQNGKSIGETSDPTNLATARLERLLPGKGAYRLNMWLNPKEPYGSYGYVGSLDFVNR